MLCVYFSDEIRQKMYSKYLNNPDYNFEKVNRASLACGPMVKWAIAQVQTAKINFPVVTNSQHVKYTCLIVLGQLGVLHQFVKI